MRTQLRWRWYSFSELDTQDLYEVIALRQAVFIVEQQCPFADADGRDGQALHLLGRVPKGTLVAYLRLFGPQSLSDHPSIGRIVVHPGFRKTGLGRALVEEALRMIGERYPGRSVRIASQLAVESFYERMGFVRAGTPYNEDGIVHVAMIRGGG